MIAERIRAVPELYSDLVKPLAAVDQIALARLILSDLPPAFVDESDEWSEEDLHEWSHFGRQYLAAVIGESEDA